MPTGENVIRGTHTDIVLDNLEGKLARHLEREFTPETLYEMKEEGLRYPIDHAMLEFHKNDPDDMSLNATVEFSSSPVRHQGIPSWKNLIAKELKARFMAGEYSLYRLAHQTHDFYVKLNEVHAAHIEFCTTTDGCYINTSLVYLSQLAHASDDKLRFDPDPDSIAATPPHIDTLRHFVVAWAEVIDTVTDTLGGPEHEHVERSRIVISCRSREVSDDLPEPSEELMPVVIQKPLEPSELETSSRPDGLNMIGGLTQAKRRLQIIGDLVKDPVGASMYGLSPTHFVLHGPPGTGKTSLINAFANEIGAKVWPIKSTSLIDSWSGKSGKNVEDVFSALKSQPDDTLIVVVMDEFDAIGRSTNNNLSERADVIKILNLAIDDVSNHHKNIILAAATNSDVGDLDSALVRSGRIEPIGAPLPNEKERIDVWAAVLARSFLSFSQRAELTSDTLEHAPAFIPYGDDIDPIELATLTEGRTGADFEVILERARKAQHQLYLQTKKFGRVSQSDLVYEIQNFDR